ncbi:MAG: LolA family protein, partial [Flavisolibacter sp.]
MKYFFCLSIILFASFHLKAQDAETLVNQVRARLAQVKDYKAEGRMKMDVAFIDAPPSKIAVYYKSPDKFKV